MKLVMEQSSQTKHMETEMEKLLKEKEEATRVALIPLEVVPISSIPSVVPATAEASNGTDKLSKAMESMNLQSQEIKKLETHIGIPRDQKARSETTHEIAKKQM